MGDIGVSIKELRIESGMTQEQLAENSGLSVRAIRDIERGSTRKPYRHSLKLMAEAIGLSEDETTELIGTVYMRPNGRGRNQRDAHQSAHRPHSVGQPVLAHLPPGPAGLIGREDALAWLDKTLLVAAETTAVALLAGGPGAGKSAIALRWAHRSAKLFPDGVLYADLRGFDALPALSPELVLRRLLRAAGVPDHHVPLTLEECSALFRSTFAGRRCLVVLDNAASVEQVRPLLADAPHCRTLLTSRSAMTGLVIRNGVHRYGVPYLSDRESLLLFESMLGASRLPRSEDAESLVALCDHSPLAIRLMGERVRRQPHISVRHIAARAALRGSPLRAFETPGDPHSSVRTLLSWSYAALPASAKNVFTSLGRLQESMVDFREADILHTAVGLAADQVADGVEWLVEAHLLDEVTPGSYRMNNLIRWYARELAEGGTE
ncbi:helix-turn-helix domain-containing protein [Streptomyces griseofuscus]|uniref:helix-turn-helix domain-containing protein n=1 Tax=Streptomyces griseofuscus TaxID=146922 RepID=UPI0036CA3A96